MAEAASNATIDSLAVRRVRDCVARARAAQPAWAARTVDERVRVCRRLATAFARAADTLVACEIEEQGKPGFESYGALLNSIHLLRHLCAIAPRTLAEKPAFPLFGLLRVHRVTREPRGVVGIIAPWNFPLSLSLEPIFAAVLAGNAIVLKPSEFTPRLGQLIGSVCAEALPPDLVQVVVGEGAVGAALVSSGIDKLVFTGSVGNGRRVAAAAGAELVPLTLELGGKDAAIVLDDADLGRAAAGICWAGNVNAGQACLSIERVYVVDAVAEAFIGRLVEEVSRLRVGVRGHDVDVSEITTEPQLRALAAQVEDAQKRGAKILCGGRVIPGEARLFAPTVLVDVTDEMLVMKEETFGPVIAVARVRDAEEAVARTNRSPFGLTASVWTQNIARGRQLASRLRVGDVAVNEHGGPAGHGEIPWGGVKASGYGRTRGAEGLLDMTVSKHLSWPRFATAREPYWFPYSPQKERGVRAAVKVLYGDWRERLALLASLVKSDRKEK